MTAPKSDARPRCPRRKGIVLGGILTVLAACGPAGDDTPREPLRVVAVQLVPPPTGPDPSFTGTGRYVVEVHTTEGRDTVWGILTDRMPAVRGDTLVTGLVARAGRVEGAFRYDPASGRLQRFPVPENPGPSEFRAPAVAPDGRHFAYVERDTLARARLLVDRWPAGESVVRGPLLQSSCEGDGRDAVRWLDEDTFEGLIDRCVRGQRFARIRGSVFARRVDISLSSGPPPDSRIPH